MEKKKLSTDCADGHRFRKKNEIDFNNLRKSVKSVDTSPSRTPPRVATPRRRKKLTTKSTENTKKERRAASRSPFFSSSASSAPPRDTSSFLCGFVAFVVQILILNYEIHEKHE